MCICLAAGGKSGPRYPTMTVNGCSTTLQAPMGYSHAFVC